MENKDIDQAIQKLLATPELNKNIDRKVRYDLLNQEQRKVSTAKKLLALYDAGMLQLKNGTE